MQQEVSVQTESLYCLHANRGLVDSSRQLLADEYSPIDLCLSTIPMAIYRCYVLVQLVWAMSTLTVAADYTNWYSNSSLNALHKIHAAWNNTPNPNLNLRFWNDSARYPCWTEGLPTFTPWRGVQCLRVQFVNTTDNSNATNYQIDIVGLSLPEASLTGPLPAAIGDLQPLVTLSLTGNPNLTGPIPKELAKLNNSLNTLDLHSNAFYGTIPVELTSIDTLRNIDLSNNRLTGEFPDWTNMSLLEIVRFSHNRLGGSVGHYNFSQLIELQELDLSDNVFNGSFPDVSMLPALRRVNLSYNQFNGSNLKFSSVMNGAISPSLQILDLSGNGLTDPFPSFNRTVLDYVVELYLDNNSFSESLNITAITQNLRGGTGQTGVKVDVAPGTTNMKVISLKNNNIANVIYSSSSDVSPNTIEYRLQGNPYCSDPQANDGTRCFCLQICYSMQDNTDAMRKQVITIALTSTLIPLFLLILLGALLHHRSTRIQRYQLLEVKRKCEEYDVKPTIYTYRELQNATQNFDESMKLGQGGFGAVYKGVLPNNTPVAVKQLYMGKSHQGMDEFLNEMVLITGMRHRNLIKLRGCCVRGKERFLVYDYADNHDLDWVLLEGNGGHVSWPKRMNICLGVAHGLHYLHALADPKIIHRDIKASNILLDKNLEPKIADFGFALLFPEETSHILTEHVAGTRGYTAPEYATLGQLSEKADVFSFGVLCMEIVAGRKNIKNDGRTEETFLVPWVQRLHREARLKDLVDPKLKLHGNEVAEADRVIGTALLCLQYAEEMRPPMSRVVSLLQGDAGSEISEVPPHQSRPDPRIPGFDTVTTSSGNSQGGTAWTPGFAPGSGSTPVSSASDVKLIGSGLNLTSAR